MRAPVVGLVMGLALAGGSLAGCSDAAPQHASSASATPDALGGPAVARRSPPARPMDQLERPVAVRLARELAREGLTLSYLDCPAWDGNVPGTVRCRGYVDGLVTAVRVVFTRAVQGKAIGFDAELTRGVIATRNLEATLRRQGWARPDCGHAPAYPATVGMRIVCRVERDGRPRYVVATVRSEDGSVGIERYRGS